MSNYYSLEVNSDEIPPDEIILCLSCKTHVANFNDYIPPAQSGVIGLSNSVFNVIISENMSRPVGTTVANAYCRQCRKMIGWKIIAYHRQDEYVREGRFCMRLDKLCFSNYIPLLRSIEEQNFQANEESTDGDSTDGTGDTNGQNADQEGVANEEVGSNEQNTDQDGDTTDGTGDTNGQNADQEMGAHDQNADQEVGAHEQNVDQAEEDSDPQYDVDIHNYVMHLFSLNDYQGGGEHEQYDDLDGDSSTEQTSEDGGSSEQNHDQHVGANERNADQVGEGDQQVPNQVVGGNEHNVDQVGNEQDVGANEKNADQDGGGNEQNHDQDGDGDQQVSNEHNVDQVGNTNEQDVGANEKNADQDGGGNQQNHDQDGGSPMKRMKI